MLKKYLIYFYLFYGITIPSIGGLFIYHEIRNFDSSSTSYSISSHGNDKSIIYGEIINIVLKKSFHGDDFYDDSKYCFQGRVKRDGECVCNEGWFGKKCNIRMCNEDIGKKHNSLCMYVDNDEFDKIIKIEQYREFYFYLFNFLIFICLCITVMFIIKCLCCCEEKKHFDQERYDEEEHHDICKSCGKTKYCPSCNEKNYQAPPQYSEIF
uniref:EGF-like domain-containing protein n=1 Tax=Strongyloides stercoralis TaxID=6248 RepID=A0A0K0E831_STRER